jgi:competence protein ComFB
MMEIRNLMEDAVKVVVEALFALEEGNRRLEFCTCDQCKLDVACYVLNRVKPEYIVSSRGLAYSEKEGLEKVQRRADVISLVKEGWGKVSHSPRLTADHGALHAEENLQDGPVYNFPTIMGRAFDGRTFAPVSEGKVSLLSSGKLVAMMDPNWQNPFILASATAGTFIFWPKPVPCDNACEEKSWSFEIRVETPGLESMSHFIELDTAVDALTRKGFSLQRVHKVQELYLFPEGQEEDE